MPHWAPPVDRAHIYTVHTHCLALVRVVERQLLARHGAMVRPHERRKKVATPAQRAPSETVLSCLALLALARQAHQPPPPAPSLARLAQSEIPDTSHEIHMDICSCYDGLQSTRPAWSHQLKKLARPSLVLSTRATAIPIWPRRPNRPSPPPRGPHAPLSKSTSRTATKDRQQQTGPLIETRKKGFETRPSSLVPLEPSSSPERICERLVRARTERQLASWQTLPSEPAPC